MRSAAPSRHDFDASALLHDLGSNAELRSLERESDRELFFEGLLGYGGRQEISGNLEAAARVYARIQESAPAELARRASIRLDAILGRGAVGPRAEFLLRRFAGEASDPAALLAMVGAVTAFRMVRLATLAGLTANPAANFLTRGPGARAVASLAGFALEAPAFTLTGRLANQALGRRQDWSAGALSRDLASSYFVLGGLKFAGWASGAAFTRIASPVGAVRERSLRILFQQGGMFTGILLGHQLEERVGLRPHIEGATTLIDSLATLLQFNVAGRLSRPFLGSAITSLETRLEAQHQGIESLLRPRPKVPHDAVFSPVLAMAMAGPAMEGRPEPLCMEGSRFPPSSAPAYETYHFPAGGKGPRPPRLRYSPEGRRLWEDLLPELRAVDFEAPRESILTNRVTLDRADRFWEHQLRDFAKLIGGEVEVYPAERLLEPLSRQFLKPSGDLLQRAAALAGGKGRVYELSLPYANASFGGANIKGHYANLRHLMGELEDVFGRQIQLQLVQNGRMRVRFPNFALWDGLLAARFGEAAHRLIPVDGIITRDNTMRLRSNLLAPLGLVEQATLISELYGRVHAFFVPFHDVYHAAMASMLPPDLCRSCGSLYFPLQRHLTSSRLKEAHLDRLSDLDPGSDFDGNPEIFVKFTLQPFWHHFFAQVEDGSLTQRRLQQFPQFLQIYRRLLQNETLTPGVAPQWRASFDRRLNEFGDEFARLLVSVLRK